MTSTPRTGDDLDQYVSGWVPEPIISQDVLDASRARNLAGTLDHDESLSNGAVLQPLWHWVYFSDWPATSELGEDGHPREGHFLPPIPHRRRMFAGGRLTMETPLRIGAHVERESKVTQTTVKHGRTGSLLFATIEHVYRQGDEIWLTEQQDLVYRSGGSTTATFKQTTEPLALPEHTWSRRLETTASLLFRFSALSSNAHRIHYDYPYATQVEGFPALVVHGPLLAIQMAELIRENVPDRRIRVFEFRLLQPVFLGDAVAVQGQSDGNLARVSVVSGHGTEHAAAQVEWA